MRRGQISPEKAFSVSFSAHIVFILLAALLTSRAPGTDEIIYTVNIIPHAEAPVAPSPEPMTEPRAEPKKHRVPPPKKTPSKESPWLEEPAAKKVSEPTKPQEPPKPIDREALALDQAGAEKEERIKELRQSREAEQHKQDRIRELKEQARLSEIRQKAAETGVQAARPASEARRNQALVEYGERIEAIIKSNWVYVLTGQDTGLRTKIRVLVYANGTLHIITVDEPSGDRAFDRSALRAIKRTGKVEPPPFGRDEEMILNFYPDK